MGTYNHWETGEYLERIDGSGDVAYWEVDGFVQWALDSSAAFGGQSASIGVYRAETTVTGEVFGDFHAFKEYQSVVDSYSTTGVSNYDTVGGAAVGQNPIAYPNGGTRLVKRGPGPRQGLVENGLVLVLPLRQSYMGGTLTYYAYTRGKQYYHNKAVGDVSLATSYFHQATTPPWPTSGWCGILSAYTADGALIWQVPLAE